MVRMQVKAYCIFVYNDRHKVTKFNTAQHFIQSNKFIKSDTIMRYTFRKIPYSTTVRNHMHNIMVMTVSIP